MWILLTIISTKHLELSIINVKLNKYLLCVPTSLQTPISPHSMVNWANNFYCINIAKYMIFCYFIFYL